MTQGFAERSIHRVWPQIRQTLRFADLGIFPTPVTSTDAKASGASDLGDLFQKRDDLTSPLYGGNKVRTLEVLLADAKAREVRRVFSTGAFGSNHAMASLVHAPRVGLVPGAVLYPQPVSEPAFANFRRLAEAPAGYPLVLVPHWSALPIGVAKAFGLGLLQRQKTEVMAPGGATALGALGYVSAGLELAEQIAARQCPAPQEIVLPVGSNCTCAGLLVGLSIAAKKGMCKLPTNFVIRAVRVTPWPVTTVYRIVALARAASRLLLQLTGDPDVAISKRQLQSTLVLTTEQYGRGYGEVTAAGMEAVERWHDRLGITLDTTYSAKAAACALARLRQGAGGAILFWVTKSGVSPNVAAGAGPAWPVQRSEPPAFVANWWRQATRAQQ